MAFAARAGFATIHGPVASSAWGRQSWEPFRAIAFDGATPTYRNPVATEDRLVQRALLSLRGLTCGDSFGESFFQTSYPRSPE